MLLKCICEFWNSIWYNHARQLVEPPPSFEKRLYDLQHNCGSYNWHHVFQLGTPIYHHQDDIFPCDSRKFVMKSLHILCHGLGGIGNDSKRWTCFLLDARIIWKFTNALQNGYIHLYAWPMIPLWYHCMMVFLLYGRQNGLSYFFFKTNCLNLPFGTNTNFFLILEQAIHQLDLCEHLVLANFT
jgi:hypothetical protein